MSRSGYTDDIENSWDFIRWRGAVNSAINGARGQAFLRELLIALEALPQKRLISEELQDPYDAGAVCAIGAVGKARGLDMSKLDPEDREAVAKAFGIAPALAAELVYQNDEGCWLSELPECRYDRMRLWIEKHIR